MSNARGLPGGRGGGWALLDLTHTLCQQVQNKTVFVPITISTVLEDILIYLTLNLSLKSKDFKIIII